MMFLKISLFALIVGFSGCASAPSPISEKKETVAASLTFTEIANLPLGTALTTLEAKYGNLKTVLTLPDQPNSQYWIIRDPQTNAQIASFGIDLSTGVLASKTWITTSADSPKSIDEIQRIFGAHFMRHTEKSAVSHVLVPNVSYVDPARGIEVEMQGRAEQIASISWSAPFTRTPAKK